ncbi:MAG: hypothetical protein R3F34_14585 [Planctomycetota bacterium]
MRRAVLALAATLVAGCSANPIDAQMARALAEARKKDEADATRYAARAVAAPAWLVGPPTAVAPGSWRWGSVELAAGGSTCVDVVGPRGRRVRLRLPDDLVGLDAPDASGALASLGFEVEIVAVDPTADEATSGPPIVVDLSRARSEDALALEVAVEGALEVDASVVAIVAREIVYDLGSERRAVDGDEDANDAEGDGAEDGADAGWTCAFAPLRRVEGPVTRVELRARSTDIDGARRAAIVLAAVLADPRAADLGRHLVTLDAEYRSRVADESTAGSLAPREWHRRVRERLRAMCLELGPEAPRLEAPRADAEG